MPRVRLVLVQQKPLTEIIRYVLGMEQNTEQDMFIFDITGLARHMATLEPRKMNVVGMIARFF